MTIDSPALQDCWYAVATADSIADEPIAVQLLGIAFVIWRRPDGELIAAQDQCTHRQARLSAGTLDAGCLRCPYHGWAFGQDGRCVDVPSSGPGSAIPSSAHLQALPVTTRYGLVWLCPGTPPEPVPNLGVDDDAGFTRLSTGMQIWNCSATRMIDNMLDVAHFPYTHAGTFGLEQEQQVLHYGLTQLDDTFYGYEYEVVINNEGDAAMMSGGGEAVIRLAMSTGFALPFSVRSTMSYDNGIEQTLFMTAAPMTTERSYFTFVLWRNDDVSATGQEIVDFELEVAREDQQMLENLPGELSLEQGALVDVASDKASLEWRRRYRALVHCD